MTYTINTSDGNFLANIATGTVDSTSTSLSLLGKNYTGYGALVAHNYVYLTESFSNTSSPSNSLKGQVWYDSGENVLKVCNTTGGGASAFARLQVISAATAPSTANAGDLWYDTTTSQLKVRQGSNWVLAGPSSLFGASVELVKVTSRANLTTTTDGAVKTLVVLVAKPTVATTLAVLHVSAVFASEAFYFSSTAPDTDQAALVTAIHGAMDTDSNTGNNSYVLAGFNANSVHAGGAFVDTSTNQTGIGGNKSFSGNITVLGDLTVGNLTVDGDTTSTNVDNLSIEDAVIQLARGNTTAAQTYIGLQAERGATDAYFVWEESTDRWRATTSNNGTAHTDADMQCGVLHGVATSARYADLAERYQSDEYLTPGTLVQIGGANEITKTTVFASTEVFGVISTEPAYRMNSDAGTSETHPYVSLNGRVPVRVIGKVNKGDRLIASEAEGIAQALPADYITHCVENNQSINLTWAVFGKALEDKISEEEGTIEAVVSTRV